MNGDVKTKIIKRNGEEVTFDLDKIINAITKANEEVTKIHQMNQYQIMAIAEKVADQVANSSHAVNVEDIQNMVETGIMEMRGYEVAQKYVRYRFKRELRRKSNTTDDGILSLLDNINEEVNYAKYIKIIQKEKEANLKYLEVGNKKINKIESAILEHKKVLGKPLFSKK